MSSAHELLEETRRELRYAERWMLYSAVVGTVVGAGAYIFHILLQLSTNVFLHFLCGYSPPVAGGEYAPLFIHQSLGAAYLMPLAPVVGGLLVGVLVFKLAPEASGDGIDTVIDSFHNLRGVVRGRIPIIKSIASAITIGSGGSGGREGPIAQIGAGVGASLASIIGAREDDRRELLVCGVAGGIGAIFKSPVGGAIFATEVLYKRDFEVKALIPAIISSIVSYTIFSSLTGWKPLFHTPNYQFNAESLVFYALLGIVCAPFAALWIFTFHKVRGTFNKIGVPPMFKPALGAALLGMLIILMPPEVIGGMVSVGYGSIQLAIDEKLLISSMLLLVFAKILATSFSIGSGGSGGVFGPSIVIGGMLGGVVGSIFHILSPHMVNNSGSFVIVGMAAFLAGAAKAPIASVIMVCEMTKGYDLLVPTLLASSLCYVLTGERWTIYEKQVGSRAESPAHRGEMMREVLEEIRVGDAMTRELVVVSPESTVSDVLRLVDEEGHIGYPVVRDGELIGIVTLRDLERVPSEKRGEVKVGSICSRNLVVTYPDEDLDTALNKLVAHNIGRLPVVERGNQRKIVGIVTRSDIARAHARARGNLG